MTRIERFDFATRDRIERVRATAERFGENGIVNWAIRAVNDAMALGRARDRDIATLTRLEKDFSSDFYNGSGGKPGPIHA